MGKVSKPCNSCPQKICTSGTCQTYRSYVSLAESNNQMIKGIYVPKMIIVRDLT